ncbi:MAG: 5'-methylthioadenosine/adenosylhomocysteine nucleosidase [Phycisphaerales bacterium]
MLALLSAMPQEIEALAPLVARASRETVAGREVIRGELFGRDVALVFSRWGKTAAAATCAHVVSRYQPSNVIFSGIAGSLSEDLGVGDVVLAGGLYHHDLDASPFFAPTQVPLLNLSKMPVDVALTIALHRAGNDFLKHEFASVIGAGASFIPSSPRRCVVGDVATGDRVVSTSTEKLRILNVVPSAVCVEMEGAAVAQVCHECSVPFACIRVISDHADDSVHNTDILELAKLTGVYTAGILRRWIERST